MKKLLLLTLSVIMGISVLYAQQKVTGTVISTEDGDPLPFVTVVVTGMTIATQTNADGTYSINIPATGKYLTFTVIGKKIVVAEINGRPIVNVQLSSEAVALEDVIVVAYGTAKKE